MHQLEIKVKKSNGIPLSTEAHGPNTYPMSQAIPLDNGTLRAVVLPFGATLARLCFAGTTRSLILGFDDLTDFQRSPFYSGAIVGPLANRLTDGKARIDGRVIQMPRNENGRTSLHSGPEGLHRRHWQTITQSETTVTLRCTLHDGECGLPGHRDIEATYSLDGNSLLLQLTATSDRTTLMNLAHHPYWAVDKSARLRVSADSYLPVNEDKLPTGSVQSVEGTAFDLRKSCPIPQAVDHNFILSKVTSTQPYRVAWLQMPHYKLRVDTTAPGLQVYAGSSLPRLPIERTTGWPIEPYSGLALEPQIWPDAPNNPSFPSAHLEAHTQWSQNTLYTIEK